MAADPTVPAVLVKAFQESYELVRETGRGGSATVYLARDLKHDRFVAIKVLASDLGQVPGERFLREIRVSAGMQHPHILPIYDSGIAEGRLYFVMPFVDGGSLRDKLNATAALPLDEALHITRDIGIALTHAHGIGVVHRDVKPENIMFYHATACLADFGIARSDESFDTALTAHGTIIGTPAYMSPEQYSAGGFDGRSDVYSLACVLYEMLAGVRLFAGATVREILMERGAPPSLRTLRPKLPEYVFELLDRGLANSPAERFPDAHAFVEALDEALRRTQGHQRDSIPKRAIKSVSRNRWAYGLGAAALMILIWPVGTRGPLESGRTALAAYDIPTAQKAFSLAINADSNAAAPRLWLAESYALGRRLNDDNFRQAAIRLEKVRHQLRGRDSLFAEALLAFARGTPAAACTAYTRQLQQDSTDALAWYGLGDCQLFDSTVVRDSKSPSGWRFASSYESAARAYVRAVTIDPTAHAILPYDDLTRLLPADVSMLRMGRSAGSPRQLFFAYPALVADSLAFVPYPLGAFSVVRQSVPTTQQFALKRNRDLLLDFAKQWTVASPKNGSAWEALARAREGRGELADDEQGAGGAISRARTLTTDSLHQLLLGVAQVRVHVKRGEFRRARTLSDSIIERWQAARPAPRMAVPLSGLAALTGRVQLTTDFMNASQSNGAADVEALAVPANRFFARAALGICDDTLTQLRQDFERVLGSYSTPSQRDQTRSATLSRAAALAFPCLRSAALDGITPIAPLDRAQRAFAARDMGRTRMLLDSLLGVRAGNRPGDVSLDHTVQEAWLRAEIGDSTGAERQLDLVLDALSTLSSQSVTEEAQSAAIGRAMVLRADLAAARHDTLTARRWAGHAIELWGSADASLKPTLDRMKALTTK